MLRKIVVMSFFESEDTTVADAVDWSAFNNRTFRVDQQALERVLQKQKMMALNYHSGGTKCLCHTMRKFSSEVNSAGSSYRSGLSIYVTGFGTHSKLPVSLSLQTSCWGSCPAPWCMALFTLLYATSSYFAFWSHAYLLQKKRGSINTLIWLVPLTPAKWS